jgi:hypothetical protein
MDNLKEPEGIAFFSIKTGETHYCRLEPTIAAYINSSDMGINASRGQDFGWRLDPEWVKKIRNFRSDEDRMDTLAAKLRLEDGVSPSTTQILYYIYGRQVRQYLQRLREEDAPFEEQYQKDISPTNNSTHLDAAMDDDPVTESVSESDLAEEPAEKSKSQQRREAATKATPEK